MRLFLRWCWLPLLVLCGVNPVQAQRPGLTVEHFSKQEGLSHADVRAVLQDRQGFIWIGTQDGLNRFDGYSFTTFRHKAEDPNSLSSNNILSLYEDQDGIIWLGTTEGLNRLNPVSEEIQRFAADPNDESSLSHPLVSVIFEDRTGTLWIGTLKGGLHRLDRTTNRFTRYRHLPGVAGSLSDNTVLAIYEDSRGLLWIGTSNGLNRFDPATGQFTTYQYRRNDPTSLGSNTVFSIYEDRKGRLWLGTLNAGLHRFDRTREQFTQIPHDPTRVHSSAVTSIQEDDAGILWLGTRRGLVRFDPDTESSTSRLLPETTNQTIYSILQDQSGVIWAGSRRGLFKIVPAQFVHYRHDPSSPNSLSHNRVLALLEDQSDVLWIGTRGGLDRLDRQTGVYTHFALETGPPGRLQGRQVSALLEDTSGRLWVGTDMGLHHYDASRNAFTYYQPDPESDERRGSNAVLMLHEQRDGSLLVGTGQGILHFDPNLASPTFSRLTFSPTLLYSGDERTVAALLEDQDGSYWIGSPTGLYAFNPTTHEKHRYLHHPDSAQGLSHSSVLSLYQDSAGILWVGTRHGLNRFDPASGQFTQFTPENGFPRSIIYGIQPDDQGHLWLSTENGLVRFDPTTPSFSTYGVVDGVQGEVFNPGASHANAKGELFFGGINGFNVFHPGRVAARTEPFPVVLTHFEIRGGIYQPDGAITALQDITLEHNQDFFAFEFSVLDYRALERNQYRYILEGFDKAWIESGSRRFASYTNVSPGSYVFRVQGAGSDGVWNEEGLAIRLTVEPPFWRAPWFYALCALLGLALLTYVRAILKNRELESRSLELEQLVTERTKDLQAEKQKTERQAEKLRESERLKSRFYANVSHEFRTPLTLILGPVQDALTQSYGPLSDSLRQHLQIMQRNGSRLQNLINQLLDLSRLEDGGMTLDARPHDFLAFIQSQVQAFTPLADRKQILLQFLADDTIGTPLILVFDADKLGKIMHNLLSNAFKFTEAQGKVLIGLTCESVDTHVEVTLSVKDTGHGIPSEDLPYLFDRFYQVSSKNAEIGSGIGLALAKELAELHGGTIHVESEPGFGSTFSVKLPLPAASPEQVVPVVEHNLPGTEVADTDEAGYLREDEDKATPSSKPTILLVEDNADMRVYLRGLLEPRYQVEEATNGQDGLKQAHTLQPALVISDVMMPEMDGYAFCKALKAEPELSQTPVILLTARATTESEVEGLEARADDYIRKPFHTATLLARVENLIEIRHILRASLTPPYQPKPSEIDVESADAIFLNRVQAVVEAHMANSNFGVDLLADEVGLSPRQLQRRIRALSTLSAAGYIRSMRLQRAAQLLDQRAGTVSEIAYQVGFRNVNHFSKLFRQTFGVSPSAYMANGT